jgi:NOL1/NOP2/fmu family ribosome biogenesis protein
MRKELDQREREELAGKIESQFGFKLDSQPKYYLKEEKEGRKIFLYTASSLPELDAAWLGLHYGTLIDGLFCPSIEGAMLMKTAGRNAIEVSRKELEELMRGNDIENKKGLSGYVIVKTGEMACPAMAKEGRLASMTPKSRRI